MKITCGEVTKLLVDLVENSLPIDQRLQLEQHICGCLPCMIYLTSYRQTIQLTHQLPQEPMPCELIEKLKSFFQKVCHCPKTLAEEEAKQQAKRSQLLSQDILSQDNSQDSCSDAPAKDPSSDPSSQTTPSNQTTPSS